MCTKEKVNGLRMFLYGVLDLIKAGKSETCSFVEENLSTGIATALYKKYNDAFYNTFNADYISEIDEYYKNAVGCVDGNEDRHYNCEENDGLYLLLKLTLNKIC